VRTRRRIALIAGASAILALGLEVAARVYAHATGRERGLALDARLGWRPLPNVEKRGALWGEHLPARTNALGWRDKPRETAKPAGTKRALLLGDSYVFGVGVDDGLRVSDALEREIAGLEAWNLGVTAYGPDQELLLLQSVAGEYAPDIVVWFACLSNDVEDVRHERRYGHAKPWFELDGEAIVEHAPASSVLDAVRDASYLVEFLCTPLDARRLAHAVAPPWADRDGSPLFARIAAEIHATALGHGARFLCVVIPSQVAHSDARALEVLRARQLDPFELAPAFHDARERPAELHLADGHWNAAGHALAAQAVATELRRRGYAR